MAAILPFEPVASHGFNTGKRKLNVHRLRKRDFVWLATHTCAKHGVNYLEHPRCFFVDLDNGTFDKPPIEERIGFFDIEASNLKANFGYMFSYCIKDLGGTIKPRVVQPGEIIDGTFDRRLCRQLCSDMTKYDRLVVYWGKDRRFDLPFVRSRVLFHQAQSAGKEAEALRFPEYMELYIEDLYDTVRGKLCLHRNRMEVAADFFGIPSKQHRLEYGVWVKAMAGDQESLDYILTHNKEDVITLEALWQKLHGFKRRPKTSV